MTAKEDGHREKGLAILKTAQRVGNDRRQLSYRGFLQESDALCLQARYRFGDAPPQLHAFTELLQARHGSDFQRYFQSVGSVVMD